jgi:hypothetical protein
VSNAPPSRYQWAITLPSCFGFALFFLPAITFPPDTSRRWSVATGVQRGYDAAAISASGMVLNTISLFADANRAHLSWGQLFVLLLTALWLRYWFSWG